MEFVSREILFIFLSDFKRQNPLCFHGFAPFLIFSVKTIDERQVICYNSNVKQIRRRSSAPIACYLDMVEVGVRANLMKL